MKKTVKKDSENKYSVINVKQPSNKNYCWICCKKDKNAKVCPCMCSGDYKYAHNNCLVDWIVNNDMKNCPQCKCEYEMTTKYRYSFFKYLDYRYLSETLTCIILYLFIFRLNKVVTMSSSTNEIDMFRDITLSLTLLFILLRLYLKEIKDTDKRCFSYWFNYYCDHYNMDISTFSFLQFSKMSNILMIFFYSLTKYIETNKNYYIKKIIISDYDHDNDKDNNVSKNKENNEKNKQK